MARMRLSSKVNMNERNTDMGLSRTEPQYLKIMETNLKMDRKSGLACVKSYYFRINRVWGSP